MMKRLTWRVHIAWVQFSSVRFKMVFTRSEKPIHAFSQKVPPVPQKFPKRCLWNGSNVRLIDDGPLSSFQGFGWIPDYCLRWFLVDAGFQPGILWFFILFHFVCPSVCLAGCVRWCTVTKRLTWRVHNYCVKWFLLLDFCPVFIFLLSVCMSAYVTVCDV